MTAYTKQKEKDMYEQMKEELLQAIKDILPDDSRIITFTVYTKKQRFEAFIISQPNSFASPIFYFGDYFMSYITNTTPDDLAKEIVGIYYLSDNIGSLLNLQF